MSIFISLPCDNGGNVAIIAAMVSQDLRRHFGISNMVKERVFILHAFIIYVCDEKIIYRINSVQFMA